MQSSFLATAFALLLSGVNLTLADPQTPTVIIDAGVIVGTTTSLSGAATGVNKFFGVPFGPQPKRFSPPQKPQSWSHPLNTTALKPACIQQFSYPEAYRKVTQETFNTPAPEESEDCLYLNILAPAAPVPGKGRAVLFWIFGGALQFGHGGAPLYDGSAFAAHEDVIIVTSNYRTNVFGFPNSPELPIQGRNPGFLDQRLALDCVQRNIHAFGGDAAKVTMFGESAGSWSVDALLTSFPKASPPPFRAGAALVANDTAAAGIPSWRFYFNATFPNTQKFSGEGVYHSSEIYIIFGTYPAVNVTAQEYALHNYMRGAWAKFAKDPIAGPGWNAVGTGSTYYRGAADLDVGVLGSDGSAGVKVVRQSEVDSRCALWAPIIKRSFQV